MLYCFQQNARRVKPSNFDSKNNESTRIWRPDSENLKKELLNFSRSSLESPERLITYLNKFSKNKIIKLKKYLNLYQQNIFQLIKTVNELQQN